jgi:hypothetical protein
MPLSQWLTSASAALLCPLFLFFVVKATILRRETRLAPTLLPVFP